MSRGPSDVTHIGFIDMNEVLQCTNLPPVFQLKKWQLGLFI